MSCRRSFEFPLFRYIGPHQLPNGAAKLSLDAGFSVDTAAEVWVSEGLSWEEHLDTILPALGMFENGEACRWRDTLFCEPPKYYHICLCQ